MDEKETAEAASNIMLTSSTRDDQDMGDPTMTSSAIETDSPNDVMTEEDDDGEVTLDEALMTFDLAPCGTDGDDVIHASVEEDTGMTHELSLDSFLDAPDLIPTSSFESALTSQDALDAQASLGHVETPPPPATPIPPHTDDTNAASDYQPTANSNPQTHNTSNTNHNAPNATPEPALCFGCRQPITDRFLLSAMDVLWHENCLKCSCCGCRLGDVGTTFFTKSNHMLCKRDYLRYKILILSISTHKVSLSLSSPPAQVVRQLRAVRHLSPTYPRFRDGDESEEQRLSRRVLQVPAMSTEVSVKVT